MKTMMQAESDVSKYRNTYHCVEYNVQVLVIFSVLEAIIMIIYFFFYRNMVGVFYLGVVGCLYFEQYQLMQQHLLVMNIHCNNVID